MTTYQVIDGWNNAANLADVSIQPRSDGIRPSEAVTGLTGVTEDEGTYFFEWEYTHIPATDLGTVLTELGVALGGARSNLVTVKTLKDPTGPTWQNYNAVVERPPDLANRIRFGFCRRIIIKFTDAEEL